jgi:hypothetical protein
MRYVRGVAIMAVHIPIVLGVTLSLPIWDAAVVWFRSTVGLLREAPRHLRGVWRLTTTRRD